LESIEEWNRLTQIQGFDLGGVFRRRKLIPVILVPRHVSNKHSGEASVNLFALLRDAHNAFIYGASFAALALLRATLEVILVEHYGAASKDDLSEKINSSRNLPRKIPPKALHALRIQANKTLHFDKENLPENPNEMTMVKYFLLLRELIEASPKILYQS
jgi:hypothetical protein